MLSKISRVDIVLLVAALACIVMSELLWFKGEHQSALFVGLWAPTVLGLAVFLKLIKLKK